MKKYRIFPKEAIISFLVIMLIGFTIVTIIDKKMPQYGTWKKENICINQDRKLKMKSIKNEDYPLIQLRKSDISQGNTKKKILVVGDSFVEGDGYSNLNQTWWRQLEIELHNRGYYDVEVYGAGKDGASTYDEMKWLSTTSLVEDIKPDLIMIGYVINDPEIDDEKGNPIIKHTNSINYFSKNKILKKIECVFPNITYKINNMINEKIDKNKTYNDNTGYPTNLWYDIITNETWSKVYQEKAVQPLGEYLTSIDIPSFIVTTPNGVNPKHENWYHVLSFFEKAGIKTYNMFADFSMMATTIKDQENQKINYVNGHPGTAYTKYYAQYISDILERDYKECIGTQYKEKAKYPICINDWTPYSLNPQVVKEESDKITYRVTIPNKEKMLYIPNKHKHMKLSLEYPVNIKKITIKGNNTEKERIYITTIDEQLGYDNQVMKQLEKKGNDGIFEIKEEKLVTSINIESDLSEGSQIEITIER